MVVYFQPFLSTNLSALTGLTYWLSWTSGCKDVQLLVAHPDLRGPPPRKSLPSSHYQMLHYWHRQTDYVMAYQRRTIAYSARSLTIDNLNSRTGQLLNSTFVLRKSGFKPNYHCLPLIIAFWPASCYSLGGTEKAWAECGSSLASQVLSACHLLLHFHFPVHFLRLSELWTDWPCRYRSLVQVIAGAMAGLATIKWSGCGHQASLS